VILFSDDPFSEWGCRVLAAVLFAVAVLLGLVLRYAKE
jgi:hypothetical protein